MTQKSIFGSSDRVVDNRQPWADLSECERYRWALGRPILPPEHAAGVMLFIMLNPSTADALTDDPTINRCRGFAMREAMTELVVCNLSAWRATKPVDLWKNHSAWQAEQATNLEKIRAQMGRALYVVCAWGAHGARDEFKETKAEIANMAQQMGKSLVSFGVTASGEPRHPLYLAGCVPLTEWPPGRES